MKHFKIILFALFGLTLNAQIKLAQLQPCQNSLGAKLDSCCMITLNGGILKYLTPDQCKALYKTNITVRTSDSTILVNGVPLDNFCLAVKKCETPNTTSNNSNGSYTLTNEKGTATILGYRLTCVNDSTLSIADWDGTVVNTCIIKGGQNPNVPIAIDSIIVQSDSTIVLRYTDGSTAPLDICDVVNKCEVTTTLINNSNGSYQYQNEKGTIQVLGYKLSCVNDSTISVTDWDGTVVNTCIIRGGSNPDVPIAVNNLTVESDSTILLHFTDGSTAPLDICNVVKKCETPTYISWDVANNYYVYTNEKGEKDTINYRLDPSRVSSTGFIYFQGNGTDIDSFNLCNPNCPPIPITTSDDTYSTNNCMNQYCADVSANDVLCPSGISTYSLVTGTNTNGNVFLDASGDFCFEFTSCDPNLVYQFTYQAQCKDGTTSTSVVTIDLEDACGAVAEQDNTQLAAGTTKFINLALNDTDCGIGIMTKYIFEQQATYGVVFINEDGTATITAGQITGRDSALYSIWCNGQYCDTAWIKWVVYPNNPAMDDYYYPLSGVPLTTDISTNDQACPPPLVTSYAWTSLLTPTGAGTISGTLPSVTFTGASGFCGTASRPYAQLCDADTVSRARVYWNMICADAVDDMKEFTETSLPLNGTVKSNDVVCTNGGTTTYHLVSNPTAHGTGLNIPIYKCDKAGCPATPLVQIDRITAWDTMTGNYTIDSTSSIENMCFRYFIKCKNPHGQQAAMDTACVEIIPIPYYSMDSIQITMPSSTVPSFTARLGAWCENTLGTKKALDNGDRINIKIEPIGVDVDLIVGQNICTAAGYTNDVSNRWANWVVPSITSCPVTLTASSLLTSGITFNIRKDSLSKRSDHWGDGSISSTKIGKDLLWTLTNANCTDEAKQVDTIPKLYEAVEAYASIGQVCYASGSGCCSGLSSYVNAYISWGFMARTMGVTYADAQASTTSFQLKCANGAFTNTTEFPTTISGVFNNYGYGLEQACLSCAPLATFNDSVQYRFTWNDISSLPNITIGGEIILNSSIIRYSPSGANYLQRGLSAEVEQPGFITPMGDLRDKDISRRTWGLNLHNDTNLDSVRIYVANAASGDPFTGYTQLITNFPYGGAGAYFDGSGTPTLLADEGKYWKFARASDTGVGTTKWSKSLTIFYSY